MADYAKARLESRIMEGISMMIAGGEIKHPHLNRFVSISHIDLSSDNAYATIYISSLFDDNRLERSVEALNSAAGYIQKRLGAVIHTRNTPKLTFKVDDSAIRGERVNKLIEQVMQEQKEEK